MKTFIGLILWFILLVLCWPLALLALILYPFIWLLSLPFRILGMTVTIVLALIGTLLMLPFTVLRAV